MTKLQGVIFMKKLAAVFLVLIFLSSCTNPANDNTPNSENVDSSFAEYEETSQANTTALKTGFTLSGDYAFVKLGEETSAPFFLDDGDEYIAAFGYDSFLRIYSTRNGSLVYSKDYSSLGNIMRMEKYSDKEGYDYRICFGDRIIYLSFKDFSKSEEITLPNGLAYEINHSFAENGYYDMSESAFVYSDENGIILNSGSYEKRIAENSLFQTVNDFLDKTGFDQCYDIPSPVYFNDPRFICRGTKIVVGVFSEWDAAYVGCAIYDIERDEFENYIYCHMPQNPVYPIEDRYINIRGVMLFDVSTGTSEKIDYGNYGYESYDYKTFVTYNFEMNEDYGSYKSFEAFVFDLETKEKKDFFTLNEDADLFIEGITRNWFIIEIRSSYDNGIYMIKYNVNQ